LREDKIAQAKLLLERAAMALNVLLGALEFVGHAGE
jgi:hypothetical protein